MCGANKRTLTIIIFCIFSENDVYKYAGSCTIVNGHKCLAAHSRNNLLKYLQEITRYICASNFTEILQPNKGFVVSDNLYVFDHCFVKSGEDHWVCICGIHIHDLGLPDDDRTIFPLKCTYEDIKQPCKKSAALIYTKSSKKIFLISNGFKDILPEIKILFQAMGWPEPENFGGNEEDNENNEDIDMTDCSV